MRERSDRRALGGTRSSAVGGRIVATLSALTAYLYTRIAASGQRKPSAPSFKLGVDLSTSPNPNFLSRTGQEPIQVSTLIATQVPKGQRFPKRLGFAAPSTPARDAHGETIAGCQTVAFARRQMAERQNALQVVDLSRLRELLHPARAVLQADQVGFCFVHKR